jgi:murein DD-endopeptidase MepM/ murein hydrolase activator NlpD
MKENSGKNTSRSVNNVDISNIMWPLKGEVSQGIGISYSKTFGDYRYHDGIDIQGDRGVEVVAVLAGKVTKKETTKSDGIKVTINHGGGWTSIYKHLGDSYLQVGDEVKIGENVGSINQPGMSEIMEGPHLHYTILKDNKVINPLDYLSR